MALPAVRRIAKQTTHEPTNINAQDADSGPGLRPQTVLIATEKLEQRRWRMFKPPHPGLTLRDDVLPALGLTVTQAAQQLGVSRVALSRVLNGRADGHGHAGVHRRDRRPLWP